MKILLCDLKGTIVDSNGRIRVPENFEFTKVDGARTILYSMNEAWTYDVLEKNAKLFRTFDTVLLCKVKKMEDFAQFQADDVLVVGDSWTEELTFAKAYGYRLIDATESFPIKEVSEFMELTS